MNQGNIEAEDKSITLSVIADLFTEFCDHSTQDKSVDNKITKYFSCKKIPNIDIKKYLERLMKYTNIEKSTLMLILIYIDRLCELNKTQLNYFNIHKLIIASMLLAIKFNEDDYFANEFYAKLGGITKVELNRLEYEFLALIDFNLYVSDNIFEKYSSYLLTFQDEA